MHLTNLTTRFTSTDSQHFIREQKEKTSGQNSRTLSKYIKLECALHTGYTYYIFRPLVKSMYPKNYFSHFSTKTYVVGTQKNRLNETVLLNTQNIC